MEGHAKVLHTRQPGPFLRAARQGSKLPPALLLCGVEAARAAGAQAGGRQVTAPLPTWGGTRTGANCGSSLRLFPPVRVELVPLPPGELRTKHGNVDPPSGAGPHVIPTMGNGGVLGVPSPAVHQRWA